MDSAPAEQPARPAIWRRILRAVLVVALLAALAWLARPHVAEVGDALTPALAAAIVLAAVLHAVANGVLADAWGQLLRLLGDPLAREDARRIWARAQLARFAIGSGHLVSRPALARGAGVRVRVAVTSTLLETVWMTGVTAATTVGLAPLWLDGGRTTTILLAVAAVGAAYLVALTAVPRAALRPATWALARLGRPVEADLDRPVPLLTGRYVLNAGLRTAAFIALVAALDGGVGLRTAGVAAAAFLAGNLAGWVVAFAPGGLGPREAVSALILAEVLDGPQIIVVLAATRLAELAAEGLFLAVAGRRGRVDTSGTTDVADAADPADDTVAAAPDGPSPR